MIPQMKQRRLRAITFQGAIEKIYIRHDDLLRTLWGWVNDEMIKIYLHRFRKIDKWFFTLMKYRYREDIRY